MSATLDDWLARLERQHPVSIDMGLERVAVVAERLGLTQGPIAHRVVTVAGTNGKGST
ncbi:MAG: bifunctional folylpolyglutamate synthase/dihydrofolate synthase, partial [Salinicola sp.]|nr:bifunctional folylpolyglutamate synthase/dihydrofolate synthase [Salinicola sp.]